MKRLLASLAVVLCACGGGDVHWPGTYTGAFVATISCSDGTTGSNSSAIRLVVTESGKNLFFDDGSDCALFTASASGSSASVNPKVCPPFRNDYGVLLGYSIDSGTATLHGNDIAFALQESFATLPPAPSITCTGAESGTLTLAQ